MKIDKDMVIENNWYGSIPFGVALALGKKGFGGNGYDFDIEVDSITEQTANGDTEHFDWVELKMTHLKTGIQLNVQMKFFRKYDDVERDDTELAELYLNGEMFCEYYHNYFLFGDRHGGRLLDEFRNFIAPRIIDGIDDWVARGGKLWYNKGRLVILNR